MLEEVVKGKEYYSRENRRAVVTGFTVSATTPNTRFVSFILTPNTGEGQEPIEQCLNETLFKLWFVEQPRLEISKFDALGVKFAQVKSGMIGIPDETYIYYIETPAPLVLAEIRVSPDGVSVEAYKPTALVRNEIASGSLPLHPAGFMAYLRNPENYLWHGDDLYLDDDSATTNLATFKAFRELFNRDPRALEGVGVAQRKNYYELVDFTAFTEEQYQKLDLIFGRPDIMLVEERLRRGEFLLETITREQAEPYLMLYSEIVQAVSY